MPRGANFSREELDSFLDSVEEILPLSTTQWESVVEIHSARYPDKGRTVDSLKRKFKELHIKRIPTGDPHCPPAVRRAKHLRNAIIEMMDGTDLNSPARGGGQESGESSGGSDDDNDNQDDEERSYVDDAPIEAIDSSEATTSDAPTGEEAPRLPPTVASRGRRGSTTISSTATSSSNNRRRTSTHNTPISRPRNRQRENSPEDTPAGDRVGNVMAMMMMSQAQDRDERREEREERRQEFRLQIEMQRQQMQNQQNMMAMIMVSMMGRRNDASGSVPNDGVVNMLDTFAANNSTEQNNDGEGSNSNTQE